MPSTWFKSNFGVKTRIFNAILAQIQFEKSPLVDYYQSRGAVPVICNKEELISKGYYVLQAPLYSKKITPTLRHDPRRLARAVMFINRKMKFCYLSWAPTGRFLDTFNHCFKVKGVSAGELLFNHNACKLG